MFKLLILDCKITVNIKIYKVQCYDKGEIHSPYVHVADRVAGICEVRSSSGSFSGAEEVCSCPVRITQVLMAGRHSEISYVHNKV